MDDQYEHVSADFSDPHGFVPCQSGELDHPVSEKGMKGWTAEGRRQKAENRKQKAISTARADPESGLFQFPLGSGWRRLPESSPTGGLKDDWRVLGSNLYP